MVRTLLEISAFLSPCVTFCPHIFTRRVRRLSSAPGCLATLRHRSVTTDASPPARHHISCNMLVPWQIRHGARLRPLCDRCSI
ncbi:hypothetical protein B0H21DRAFT_759202 [Amylocystis lapponica]|nr:hypothetical protein B0H21DRAFT_759202 [Amylocystis lapponica]